jgi:thioredoxin reductase
MSARGSVAVQAPGGRHEVDLLVIGAGPVGLYATYYAGFRKMRVAVMDALAEPGGQLTALYPEKPIFDVAGHPHIRAGSLVDNLVEQASSAQPLWLLGETAAEVEHREQSVTVRGDREPLSTPRRS